jgi:hypothetical protein
MQYVLQQRHDEQQARLTSKLVHHAVNVLARSGMGALLDWPESVWSARILFDAALAEPPARSWPMHAIRSRNGTTAGAGRSNTFAWSGGWKISASRAP